MGAGTIETMGASTEVMTGVFNGAEGDGVRTGARAVTGALIDPVEVVLPMSCFWGMFDDSIWFPKVGIIVFSGTVSRMEDVVPDES